MGKTYYCDYCERFFKDDIEARKKHLSGMQHVANKEAHYNMYKDPETILKEIYEKTPCKRYMTVGDCAFGLGCRYSHYTPQMIWELQQFVAMKNSKDLTVKPNNKDDWPNSEDIIKEYFEHTIDSNSIKDRTGPIWGPKPAVGSYLPPSLRPVTSETMIDCNFSKWG